MGLQPHSYSALIATVAQRRNLIFVVCTMALLGINDCARSEPVPKPVPPQEQLYPLGRRLPPEPHLLEGSGVTVWAKKSQGLAIAGLDGAVYDPYRTSAILHVQKELRDRGLYEGPINGILDRPTMKSIYAFQEATNLQRCGVPTPRTRRMLEQGSHTDLGF